VVRRQRDAAPIGEPCRLDLETQMSGRLNTWKFSY
jgi:hypothetical protein